MLAGGPASAVRRAGSEAARRAEPAVAQLDGQGGVRDDDGECAVLVQPAEGDLLTGD